jgi:NAD(P)-dependent dehydrogenase (short-subunit alcohol dehydrogenase family)
MHPESLREQAVADTPEATFLEAAEGPMRAAIAAAQAAFPALRDSGRGRIVFVVPTIGSAGAVGFAAACAVAEGLRGMAKSLAKQWGKYGITVNSLMVAPQLVVAGELGEKLAEGVSIAVPALGTADPAADLAPVVALLASEDAHYATASTLLLDGGVWTVL